jgi:putative transposase
MSDPRFSIVPQSSGGMMRKQLKLDLRTWGGKRKGAGRKQIKRRPGVSHKSRPELRRGWAVHATLRVREHVWNLRNPHCFEVIANALAGVNGRGVIRIIHFAVLGNHLHVIVEAANSAALARGMSGLMIRIAKRLNRLLACRGPVFEDHYHSHPLRNPTEAARAISYVVGNFARHTLRRGEAMQAVEADPFSSAYAANSALVAEPVTWLLKEGWTRAIRVAA